MKNSTPYIYFIRKFSLLVFACVFLINCSAETSHEQTVIIVKVPPFYDDKLSDEENFWRFNSFLFPQEKVPDPISKGIPNYDAILSVSVESNGNIKLNMTDQGNVSDTGKLQITLEKFFEERKEQGAYEPNSQRIVKAVGISADDSVKYKDFLKVVEALQKSGADPIVLRFDDDAGNFKNYFKK